MNWLVKSTKKLCTILNRIEHFLIMGYAITGYISITAFASLVGISMGITNFAIRLKIFVIKEYKSIIKKKKKKHNRIVLLEKSKLNRIEILISKTLF